MPSSNVSNLAVVIIIPLYWFSRFRYHVIERTSHDDGAAYLMSCCGRGGRHPCVAVHYVPQTSQNCHARFVHQSYKARCGTRCCLRSLEFIAHRRCLRG